MPGPELGSPGPLMNHKPRYLQAEQGNKERWLISYTDLVTILMILFVAIAAQGFHSIQQPSKAVPKPQSPPARTPEASKVLMNADQKLRQQGLDSRLEK